MALLAQQLSHNVQLAEADGQAVLQMFLLPQPHGEATPLANPSLMYCDKHTHKKAAMATSRPRIMIKKIVVRKATTKDLETIVNDREWQVEEYDEFIRYLSFYMDFNPICEIAEEVTFPAPFDDGEDDNDLSETENDSPSVGQPQHVEKSESIVGFIMAKTERNLLMPCGGGSVCKLSGHITNLVVMSTHRRKGIAKKLLRSMQSRLTTKPNVGVISLHVRESNETAIQLYKSMQYQEVSRIQRYYKNGDTAIRMELLCSKK